MVLKPTVLRITAGEAAEVAADDVQVGAEDAAVATEDAVDDGDAE